MLFINKDKIKCPRCNSRTKPAKAMSGGESTFWVQCTKQGCITFIDTYLPMDYQQDFHADSTRYGMVAGGYGSAKTTTCYKDDEKHIALIAGRTLVCANTLPQIENTIKKDFENDFPAYFVKKRNVQKNTVTFINGHELMYRPLNDEGNLRSMNLTRFHIVEGSEADYSNFTQLQTRLRNTAGITYKTDEDGDVIYDLDDKPIIMCDVRRGLIETNPDPSWVRNEILLKSNIIKQYTTAQSNYQPVNYRVLHPESDKTTYIIPTEANVYLPPNFMREISAGKPEWWVKRFLGGSFEYSEGKVYPEIGTTLHADTPRSQNCKFMVGMDYGISDNTHFLFAHMCYDTGVVTIFKEIVMNSATISTLADAYKMQLAASSILNKMYKKPVMDAKSFAKRADTNGNELKTIGKMFSEMGVYFNPAQMDIDSRIMHVNEFIERGRLRILPAHCPVLVKEIMDYKFPDRGLDDKKGINYNKPVDKNNHGVNALEFLMKEIPIDFRNSKVGTVNVLDVAMGVSPTKSNVPQNPMAPSTTPFHKQQNKHNFKNLLGGL